MSAFISALSIVSLASVALARTDLTGCTSTDVSSPAGASVAWYVPGTGELCDFLDCGGGRAPPKTTVPGCPQYSGTLSYSPSYLPGFGSMTSAAEATASTASGSSWTDNSDATLTAWESASWISHKTSDWASSSDAAITAWSSASGSAISVPVMTTLSSVSGPSNGTNATLATPTPTPSIINTGGAMEAARVWIGGAGLVGLGAIVAML